MYFFTSDQHFGHWTNAERNIIKYCNRPFSSIEEMDEVLIARFNLLVSKNDITIHAGDFTLAKKEAAYQYAARLNGTNIFLKGGHDYWLKGTKYHEIWEGRIEKQYVVVCHYPLLSWPRSCYGSIMLHGHCHGRISPAGRRMDIGVDTNDFYPYSFTQIQEIMKNRQDNSTLIKKL